MKNGRFILISLVAGCGAADSTDTEHAPLPPTESERPTAVEKSEPSPDLDCPLALPGAQVTSEVTPDGVALLFTVNGGDPGELRARVRRMAERHNEQEVVPTGDGATLPDGDTGMTSNEGARGIDMHGGATQVASRAAVEDTSNGARVVFTPSDPAQIGVLREQIRVHGEDLASTGCGGDEPAPTQAQLPPSSGDRMPPLQPTPSPNPQEPIMPDRPVTPDQPVTPPSAPPPPTGQPFHP